MISASKYAVFVLLVLSMTGCFLKKKAQPAPAQAQAPTITTGQTATPLPTLEPETPPPAPLPSTTTEQPVASTQPVHKKKPVVHKPKPAPPKPVDTALAGTSVTPPATNAAAPPTTSDPTKTVAPPATVPPANQTATAGPAPETSSIGELSSGGDGATGSQTRRETTDLITNTENGVKGVMKRSLTSQEQETVNQIKDFLSKARQALSIDDLDGAKNLATKAKVLLDELTKP
jgi:hypothetical protein